MLGNQFRVAAAAMLVGGVVGSATMAEPEIELKFTNLFSATHKQWLQAGEQMAKIVAEKTDGRVVVTHFPAGQLGKESTSTIGRGIADMGILAPSYEPSKLPLSAVAELPGVSIDPCADTARLWHLVQEGGIIYEAELKPLGLHPLFVSVAPQYSIITSSKRVGSLAELAGLKLRANGAAMSRSARMLGAVPILVTASEIYDSLTRGTIDGAYLSIEAVRPLGLDSTLRYAVDGAKVGFGTAVTLFVINEKTWQELDQPTREIIADAGMQAQSHFCQWLTNEVQNEAKALTETGKFEIVDLPPEELARWQEALVEVAEGWAEELTAQGRPGHEVLQAYRNAPMGD